MTRRNAGIAAVLALFLAAAVGYRWWTSPERQIRAILDDVAAAFTFEAPESGLDALAGAAALQRHLAPEATVEMPGASISGRDQVVTAAARTRAAHQEMRLRFFDAVVRLDGEASADVEATAEVTTAAGGGERLVSVYRVEARVAAREGRWQVVDVRASSGGSQP
jgi:SnoaL-like domain